MAILPVYSSGSFILNAGFMNCLGFSLLALIITSVIYVHRVGHSEISPSHFGVSSMGKSERWKYFVQVSEQ